MKNCSSTAFVLATATAMQFIAALRQQNARNSVFESTKLGITRDRRTTHNLQLDNLQRNPRWHG